MTQIESLAQSSESTPRARLRAWLGGFRRITTSGNYIPEIDGLRFIAIAAVVIHHVFFEMAILNQRPEGFASLGVYGVELFFAISGFVLAAPFASYYLCGGPRVKLGSYFLRRLTRLEPPYLLALLLIYLLLVILGDANPFQWLAYFGASAFYIHNALFGIPSLITVVAWSLEIEVQFYILMPLLAMVFLIKPSSLRRTILLAAMVSAVLCQPITLPPLLRGAWLEHFPQIINATAGGKGWTQHIGNYIQFFLAGILLADVYVLDWNKSPTPRRWGDLIWLIGWPTSQLRTERATQLATAVVRTECPLLATVSS